MLRSAPILLAFLLATAGCGEPVGPSQSPLLKDAGQDGASPLDSAAVDVAVLDAAEATPVDAATAEAGGLDADAAPVWVPGNRKISGGAYFFKAEAVGAIQLQKDVTGATAYLLEFPDIKQPIAADGSFTFSGLAEGAEFTIAVVHPDYYPSLSPVIAVGDKDVTDVNFQVVTKVIATYLAAVVGFNAYDPSQCHMVVTVTAMGPDQATWWAPGEPGAVASIDPPLPSKHGPFYFNTSTLPDKTLTATTTDGGVIYAGATPGTYAITAKKEGLYFWPQKLRCVGGWLTNGVPPLGVQASKAGK